MKRTILLVFIAVLCLGMVQCTAQQPTPDTSDQNQETSAQSEEPTEAPAEEPTEMQEEPTEAPEPIEAPAEEESDAMSDQPKVLRVAATASVTTWDPSASFSTEALYMANIYEPLIYVNPAGSDETFRPGLATDWQVSDDGLEWTFTLRDGVTFHDGEPLTAEAVKASIERTIDLGTGASFIWSPVDSVEAVDDMTVKFTLSRPAPLDRIVSSTYAAWVMSPSAAEQDGEWFEEPNEAGTGPWKLESYTPDQEVVLTRNEDYWGGWDDAQFDKVVVSIVPEQVVQAQMLEGGEVDMALSLPPERIDSFRSNPDFEVHEDASFFNYVGFLNTQKPPLDDPKVRQAIAYATPYEDIITVATNDLGQQARGPVPHGLWPYSDDVAQYEYDLDKAKQLLEEAGYADGFDLVLTHAAENTQEESFAPLLKDSLSQIGINVEVRPMLWSQQWEMAKGDPAEAQDIFLLLWWPTYSDGYDNLYSMFHCEDEPFFNLGYYCNEEFDSMIDEAHQLSATDKEEAQQMYTEAMNMLVEDSPSLFFYDTMVARPVPTYLAGYEYNINYPFSVFFYPIQLAQ